MSEAASADQLSNSGWAFQQAGNARAALRDFRAALAINPDHINALIGITQAHMALKQLYEADEAAQRLLQLDPNLPQAHRIRAELFRRNRKISLARHHAEEAIRLGPREPLGYHYLAVIHFDVKDYATALKIVREGRRIAPWFGVLAAQEALILLHTKGPRVAEPLADEGLRLSPDEHYVLTIAGRVALMRGRLEKARDLLGAVLRQDANDEEAVSLYLLTDPHRYRLLRAHAQFPYWRRDHGALGWMVWLGVWAMLLAFLVVIAIGGQIPAFFIVLAYRLFWKAQYDGHRKRVKQHFTQPALKAGY